MRYDMMTCVLVTVVGLIVLVLIIVFNAIPKETDQQKAAVMSEGRQDNHPPNLHTRPICEDSSLFRADVSGTIRSCKWVAKHPTERCGSTYGHDNNGNHVYAKDACFAACDTGNCRRRGLGQTLLLEEEESLN